FARGLGIHSRTRLTYCLDGKFQGFETHLGLSDEVLDLPAKGSIRLDLFVDEKKVYSSPVIRGGDGIIKTPLIDLNDASRLSLLIDFADGFDSGDRAILGNPVLVRRNAPTKQ
ncbi:MAG: NPCBM/NEW2 domain-containing protein, partial [Planctomycetota bacterium]